MKAGDRVRAKNRKQIEGTVKDVDGDEIWVQLDNPVKAVNDCGESITTKEGFVTRKQFEEIFELIEESDWASIWDDSSN